MKKIDDIKLLENLLKIPSPSGFERKIAEYIADEARKYTSAKNVSIDQYNTVTAVIKGTGKKTVMIDAHLDEIGFIVTNISKHGIISLQYIGGGCNHILSARELVILTEKGPINAVVDRTHAHLVGSENDEAIDNIYQAQVDIGVRKRSYTAKYIKIGDPVVYKANFQKLVGPYYSGYGFDDKAGCYMLLETMREISKSKTKPVPTLVFTFSSQEEIGGKKIRIPIAKYNPDLFVELDVTFATDYGSGMEEEVGKCDLGEGVVTYRGVGIDRKTLKLLETTANTNKIKTQVQAASGRDGYTTSYATPYGAKALVIGIPLRNMHTPVEIININDLKNGYHLLKNFLLNQRLEARLEDR